MDVEVLTSAFGWLTVINSLVLILAAVGLWAFKSVAVRTHSALFGIPADALPAVYFRWLANYKLVVLAFNLAPYLALRLVG